MYVHLIIIVPLLLDSEDYHMVGLSFLFLLYVCFIPGCSSNSFTLQVQWLKLNLSHILPCLIMYSIFQKRRAVFQFGNPRLFLGDISLAVIFCPISALLISRVPVILRVHHLSLAQHMCGLHYLFGFAFFIDICCEYLRSAVSW